MTTRKPVLVLAASLLLLASCGPSQNPEPPSSGSAPASSINAGGTDVTNSQEPSSEAISSAELPSISEEAPSHEASSSEELSGEEAPSSEEPSSQEAPSEEPSSQEAPSSEEPPSSESSEEVSSEENLAHSVNVSANGYSVNFLEPKASYVRGDRIEFTLKSYGEYYKLTGVYYTEKGQNYPRSAIESDSKGVYSFLMPDMDITLHVDSDRLFTISFSGDHYKATLSQEGSYFASNTKLEMTLEIEEGYMMTGEPSGTYLSVSSDDAGTKTLGITKISDLHYSFYVPQGNATIVVPVEEKPTLTDSDPFKKEAHYSGTFHNNDGTDYYSTLYFDFPGDGTLDWRLEWYYESDDWGDWYQARPTLSGHVKLETSSVEVAFSYSKKKYEFDAEKNTLSFSSPGRLTSSGDKTWVLNVSSSRNEDGLPNSLVFTQQIDTFCQFEKSAGTVLSLK